MFQSLPVAARGVSLLLALGVPVTASAQHGLREALTLARTSAFSARAARGAVDVADAATRLPLSGILPSASLELGAMRTTDPTATFGTRLRQRSVTPAAFDPAQLNFPAAVSNYSAGLVVQAPLLNADAWAGRAAADAAADAARAMEAWAVVDVEAAVVRAWYDAVLASEVAATLRTAREAALAHARQAAAMRDAGLATKSDVLLTEIRVGELDTRVAQADADAHTARRALALRIGRPDRAFTPPPHLPDADAIRPWLALPERPRARADLEAAVAGGRAARHELRRAAAAWLPRVNSYARWDWNSALRPWDGRENWTAGVMLSLPLFQSATHLADRASAAGRLHQAEAGRDAAEAQAGLERQRLAAAAEVAAARLAIAARVITQAEEAHRLVARRYEGGLATVADLLTALAVRTEAGLGYAMARAHAITTAADLRRAFGYAPSDLAVLDVRPPSAASVTTP